MSKAEKRIETLEKRHNKAQKAYDALKQQEPQRNGVQEPAGKEATVLSVELHAQDEESFGVCAGGKCGFDTD